MAKNSLTVPVTKNTHVIPFERPASGQYDIVVAPSPDELSLITITRSLGATGIQALDVYYKQKRGRVIGRELFYTNIHSGPGSFVEAVITYGGSNDETVFGFWPDEFSDGLDDGLQAAATYITGFLESECASRVSLRFD